MPEQFSLFPASLLSGPDKEGGQDAGKEAGKEATRAPGGRRAPRRSDEAADHFALDAEDAVRQVGGLPGGLSGGLLGEPAAPAGKPRRAGTGSRPRSRFDPTTLPQPEKVGPRHHLFGTSSWTYPGWHGLVYRDVEAYGAPQRFTELSLSEYARDPRFRCAGADNMYYVAPSFRRKLLGRYAAQLRTLREPVVLCPKVWHAVTVNRYTAFQREQFRLPSEVNSHFLDAQVFLGDVVQPLASELGASLGPLLLELQENDLHEAELCRLLDQFLGVVRADFGGPLAVELRTPAHLTPRYLDVLWAHGVAHVLNSWTRMPPVGLQYQRLLEHNSSRGHDAHDWPFFLVRALLRPGVRYDDASVYEPYDRIVSRAPEVRADILRVLREVPAPRAVYVLVNNHLEGHSPATIGELQSELYGEAAVASAVRPAG